MTFQVLFGGVGDAFSIKNYGTHFFCRTDDYVLAVDCPDSYRRALAENSFEHNGAKLGVDDLDAMFVTHLHGDHVNGLEMVLAYRKFVTKRPLKIFTTPEVEAVLWDRLRHSIGVLFDGDVYHDMTLSDFAEMEVVDWETETELGPFKIETRRTIHHIPTAAMRLTTGERTLGYSCDTAFDPTLITWLQDCDTILHETSHGPAHTPLFELMALPESTREKMYIVHLPDELSDPPAELRFASQGLIIDV